MNYRLAAFPAHAGMNRRVGYGLVLTSGVPRTRGDEPITVAQLTRGRLRSPHTRG